MRHLGILSNGNVSQCYLLQLTSVALQFDSPYNLLISSILRIVIVDEAHNVEQVCEDSASLSITSTDLAGAIRECDEVANVIDGGIGLDPNADPQDLDKVLPCTPITYDY